MGEPATFNGQVIKCQCTRCGKDIIPGREVWLELDWYRGTYHKAGEVPEEHSQGGFPFGADCAKVVLAGR